MQFFFFFLEKQYGDDSSNSDDRHSNISNMSLLYEENWRGKGVIKKKRTSKYLDPCPEIKKMINKSKLRSNKMVNLINGSIATPLKIKNKTFIVNNTCAFDTIVSLICIGYYEFPKYREYLSNANNEFLQLCKSISIQGTSKKEYIKRFEILIKEGILETPSIDISGVQLYNAECNIQNLIEKLKIITCRKTIECEKCTVKNEKKIHILNLNIKKIVSKGFNTKILEKEIEKYIQNKKETCKSCNNFLITTCKIEAHIFIEVDLLEYYSTTNYTLELIPKNITINEKK